MQLVNEELDSVILYQAVEGVSEWSRGEKNCSGGSMMGYRGKWNGYRKIM